MLEKHKKHRVEQFIGGILFRNASNNFGLRESDILTLQLLKDVLKTSQGTSTFEFIEYDKWIERGCFVVKQTIFFQHCHWKNSIRVQL